MSCTVVIVASCVSPSRVEVEAAQTRRLPTSSSGALGMNSVSDEAKDDPQIYFPLMTFWPMDLQSS